MINQPASGISPAMLDAMKPEAVRARIAQFSEWFGVPPVKLSVRKGSVIMTDELLHWCENEGASIDWVFCGIAKGMAQTFRDRYADTARLTGALRKLDETERQIFEQCLIDMDMKVKAHRAAKVEEAGAAV